MHILLTERRDYPIEIVINVIVSIIVFSAYYKLYDTICNRLKFSVFSDLGIA